LVNAELQINDSPNGDNELRLAFLSNTPGAWEAAVLEYPHQAVTIITPRVFKRYRIHVKMPRDKLTIPAVNRHLLDLQGICSQVDWKVGAEFSSRSDDCTDIWDMWLKVTITMEPEYNDVDIFAHLFFECDWPLELEHVVHLD
jgi:hypothetical protein